MSSNAITMRDIILEFAMDLCSCACMLEVGIASILSLFIYSGVKHFLLSSCSYSLGDSITLHLLAMLILCSFYIGYVDYSTMLVQPVNWVIIQQLADLLLTLLGPFKPMKSGSEPGLHVTSFEHIRYTSSAVPVLVCVWLSSAMYLLDWNHPLQHYPLPHVAGCITGFLLANIIRVVEWYTALC